LQSQKLTHTQQMRPSDLKNFWIFVTLCLIPSQNYAQDGTTIVTQDLETWTSIGIKYKPTKKITFGLNQELRINQNSTLIDQIFTDLSFGYKLTKSFYLGLSTDFILDRGAKFPFEKDLRVQLDFGYKHKKKDFSFNYRLRFQNRNELGLSSSEGDHFKNHLRLRADINYNIKNWKFDPSFSAELFRDLTKNTGRFNELRFAIGTDYSFKKWGELGLFYLYQRALGTSYPKNTFVIGLNYTYTIKKNTND
jgi:hypothetical protein